LVAHAHGAMIDSMGAIAHQYRVRDPAGRRRYRAPRYPLHRQRARTTQE
jgi:hypothetical protein